MLPEAAIAQAFRRVQYRYHRDFFELLGHREISAKFADIWALCEPYIKDEPHEAQANGRKPSHWLPYLENENVRLRFFNYLSNVLEGEAEGDEKRGRKVLARKLREVVEDLRAVE